MKLITLAKLRQIVKSLRKNRMPDWEVGSIENYRFIETPPIPEGKIIYSPPRRCRWNPLFSDRDAKSRHYLKLSLLRYIRRPDAIDTHGFNYWNEESMGRHGQIEFLNRTAYAADDIQ
jgi:hypothetical protein